MDRRRYPQQQYVPPGMVDFGQIDFGHDVVAQQMPGILQNYQQRWDMQDAAIAKLLEEQAGTQMLEGDAQAVGNLLKSSFDEIDTLVKDKYQGDRGAAAMDIVKRLSAARAPLAQAKAEKERYDKAFEQYQQLAIQGRAPQTFTVDASGNIAPKTLGFEELYSDTARSAFDEKGKYAPRTYGTLRGASDLSGYLAQNVSKALNAESEQSGLLDSQTAGYLFQLTKSGTSPQQIEEQIFKNKATGELTSYGKELAQQLRGEVDFLQDELGANASDEQLMRYATPIIQGQVAQQIDRRYIQDGRDGGKPIKPIKPIISGASVNADITQNPFLEEQSTTYTNALKDYNVSGLASWLGAKKDYDNASELLNKYETRMEEIGKEVAKNTQNERLKTELEQAINAGSGAMVGAMVGKIIAGYIGAGTAGLAILPLTLRGDSRPLDEKDVKMVTNAYNTLKTVNEDIKVARENLQEQGINTSNLSDREIAKYLDDDYTLRSKTQDKLFLTTASGTKALSNMYNENPLGKLSGGFRSAESAEMLPLDVLAKKIGAEHQQLQAQVMDSKQWNYNLDTGEFGMKVDVSKDKDKVKNKTLYFTLDDVTSAVSIGLKEINKIESNTSKRSELDKKITASGKGVSIAGAPGIYDVQYRGGDNPYTVIYRDINTGEQHIFEDLDAVQVKLFTKNYIINPYLQSAYGEE